jgi:protein tyrosine phosphatase (PTP) superfamily phosphohydrolase (DUF442 family)
MPDDPMSRMIAAPRALAARLGARLAAWAGPHRTALLTDHGIFRLFWSNLHRIDDDVWRANQPSPARLRKYRKMGIRTIVSLRGETTDPTFELERETCAALGLNFVVLRGRARRMAFREELLAILDLFDTAPRPVLFHCKSGADRTGLVAALYLLDRKGASVAEAQRQLHWRFLHLRHSNTGVLDFLLAAYAADHAATGIALRPWIETVYDREALEAAWLASRGAR